MSANDLAAFDVLLRDLAGNGQGSLHLRELVSGPLDDIRERDEAREQAREVREAVDRGGFHCKTPILARFFENADDDDTTLGQLNRDITLTELIEIRRRLGV
jgi:hypothetical protein